MASVLARGRWVLDYGCGTGAFIDSFNKNYKGMVVGYEPYLKERKVEGLPIFSDINDALAASESGFGLVTLFETIEHLCEEELLAFCNMCDHILAEEGVILGSAPIEIGPGLILKELNRSILRLKMPEHRPVEFIKAALFGLKARRADNIKGSHRGFDFRESIKLLSSNGWAVEIIGYGPLPFIQWYGNSQVFFKCTRRLTR